MVYHCRTLSVLLLYFTTFCRQHKTTASHQIEVFADRARLIYFRKKIYGAFFAADEGSAWYALPLPNAPSNSVVLDGYF
jgi:hypothetical protein